DAIVRDATELGATRIVIAQTERAVVKAVRHGSERTNSKKERWRRIAEQAARQCGRADPPGIEGVYPWEEALSCAAGCAVRFCLDPRAPVGVGAALASAIARGASVAFAVGPEGGLSPDEVATATRQGFRPISLGPFVFRTETVAAALLGAVRILGS